MPLMDSQSLRFWPLGFFRALVALRGVKAVLRVAHRDAGAGIGLGKLSDRADCFCNPERGLSIAIGIVDLGHCLISALVIEQP